ncbi:RusA family crossover junction endodeoxyribonuclease [Deinococcus apachensis]|uniref:RusA family crossover junction endodeoxyribonuclease n=1 Tax=Deinococcus apachensis TaxID=309886 RepID=UPI00037A9B00|nr:RusA family crossover junction endodeoxyribonuclease [Deinococcus apachensis]
MNPFPTRQHAETYLSRIPDLAVREATRRTLGLDEGDRTAPENRPSAELRHSAVPVLSARTQPAPLNLAHVVPGARTFTLPWPPSLNSIWRATVVKTAEGPQARVLLSREGRAYRRAVRDRIRDYGHPRTPPGTRLALTLTACPPDKRARDLSNIPKALEDALTHAQVWADDSLIDELIVRRGEVCPRGRMVVQIVPLGSTLF